MHLIFRIASLKFWLAFRLFFLNFKLLLAHKAGGDGVAVKHNHRIAGLIDEKFGGFVNAGEAAGGLIKIGKVGVGLHAGVHLPANTIVGNLDIVVAQ